MAVMKFIAVLALAIAFVEATRRPGVTRNTIFADERLKGQIFEDVDAVESFDLAPRNDSPYRLPTTTKPQHYNILWTINVATFSYTGVVEIQLYATQANVNEIVIHSDHNTLASIVLTQGTTTIPTSSVLQEEGQLLRVTLTSGALEYNAATPTLYSLTISFSGEFRNDMYGIYRSWYRNAYTDQPSWMATTQFQATAARYAFPCYDEPSFKATFDVTIRRPTAFRSWFCTRLSETVNSAFTGFQDDIYYRTPVMSTYLLALIVAEFSSLEVNSNNLLMHEVIARPGAISAGQGAYAQTTGQALLAEMSDHTDYDYYSQNTNLKMTQAAIPDFGAGAMENWGLLTYREAYLMYDETHTSSQYKQLIAYILSHEIAHMWFGNLVTCDWWDVLWLNEGFARYYQYFLTYWVEGMGFETRFITEQVHTALLGDSANNPHPLSNPGVATNAQVSAMFSTISYNKGAAVIRQAEHLLGTTVHRQGLRNYLRRFNFGTAQPTDLFTALQEAGNAAGALTEYGSDFNFLEFYSSWTDQPGHPVLNVQIDHSTGQMTIYQRRFNINTGYSAAGTNYIVPITFTTGSNPSFTNTKPTHIIRDAISVIDRGTTGDQWVLFNIQQTGFYRVNYDDYTWDLITIALRGTDRTLIHEYNKAQIVNDVFSFARAGLMSYQRAFNILSFLQYETSYAPWVAAVTGFSWLRNRLAGTTQLTQLNNMIATWGTAVMNDLTYYPTSNNEDFMRSYLRMQLAPTMCLVGVQACLTAATEQFAALRSTAATEVPVDSRVWTYCNALRQGTAADFNFLWTRFQQHNVYTEKYVLISSLGCTTDQTSLLTYVDAIVQENYIIRSQDYTSAFSSAVNGNEVNTQRVFTYIQNNLQTVINAFGNAATPLSYVSARLRTIEEVEAFQTWATANQAALGTSYNAVFNGAESSRQSILWAAEVASDLNSYFVNGDDVYQVSTAVPEVVTTPSTTQQPNLVEPTTPDIPTPSPDSAVTSLLSVVALTFAIIVNILL